MRISIQRPAGAVAFAAALALTVAGCAGSTSSTSDSGGSGSGTAKLGFVGALTGPYAQLGINIYDGAELAIGQYNATNPSTKVTLVKYDTQGDPAQAPTLVKKAISDKVVGVVGPAFSGESATADPILEQGQIPNISPSATATTLSTKGWKYFHRVLANDGVQGPGDADFMANTLKLKKVAVIDDASEYGKGLGDDVRKTLKSDNVAIPVSEAATAGSADYSSTVNKIKSAGVDGIFYAGYYSDASKLIKQLRDASVTATFMSGDGTLDAKFVSGGGTSATNRAILSCTCSSAVGSTVAAVQKFASAYKAKWKTEPATYSAEGYDAADAFLMAIKAGKTSTTAINDYLSTISFTGVSKAIKFNSVGELSSSDVFITEVKNGKLMFLGNAKAAKPTSS